MPTTDRLHPAPEGNAARIRDVFNALFGASHRTVMEGGGTEPLYFPVRAGQLARIVFTRDYAASALHEAAHWCVAGAARRRRVDYGYPYRPPPRDAPETIEFCNRELRCQALERVFSEAAGLRFRVSLDDLTTHPERVAVFDRAVRCKALQLRRRGLPARAACLREALCNAFAMPGRGPRQ